MFISNASHTLRCTAVRSRISSMPFEDEVNIADGGRAIDITSTSTCNSTSESTSNHSLEVKKTREKFAFCSLHVIGLCSFGTSSESPRTTSSSTTYWICRGVLDKILCGAVRLVHSDRLGCHGKVCNTLRDDNVTLGHAETLGGCVRRRRLKESTRVRQPNVLGRKAHQSSCDVPGTGRWNMRGV